MNTKRLVFQSMVFGVYIVCTVFIPPGFRMVLPVIWSIFLAWFSPLVGHKYCFGLIIMEAQVMVLRTAMLPTVTGIALRVPGYFWISATIGFTFACISSYLTAFITIRKFNLRKRIGFIVS